MIKSFKYPLEIHKIHAESFCQLMVASMISVRVKTWSRATLLSSRGSPQNSSWGRRLPFNISVPILWLQMFLLIPKLHSMSLRMGCCHLWFCDLKLKFITFTFLCHYHQLLKVCHPAGSFVMLQKLSLTISATFKRSSEYEHVNALNFFGVSEWLSSPMSVIHVSMQIGPWCPSWVLALGKQCFLQ